jgi:hypothetical protein
MMAATVFELWHLPSGNMVGSWSSAQEAAIDILAGLDCRHANLLADHALVLVDSNDETQLVAEGEAIIDALTAPRRLDSAVKKAG